MILIKKQILTNTEFKPTDLNTLKFKLLKENMAIPKDTFLYSDL